MTANKKDTKRQTKANEVSRDVAKHADGTTRAMRDLDIEDILRRKKLTNS